MNCFFFSCGSVKHGWEKKWIVLDDQKLQLFDKENMGGNEGHLMCHRSLISLLLLAMRRYLPLFRKLFSI